MALKLRYMVCILVLYYWLNFKKPLGASFGKSSHWTVDHYQALPRAVFTVMHIAPLP